MSQMHRIIFSLQNSEKCKVFPQNSFGSIFYFYFLGWPISRFWWYEICPIGRGITLAVWGGGHPPQKFGLISLGIVILRQIWWRFLWLIFFLHRLQKKNFKRKFGKDFFFSNLEIVFEITKISATFSWFQKKFRHLKKNPLFRKIFRKILFANDAKKY